ncbi:MAG: sigma-70 family RNA polymerase sigma factor [Candidatus Edwardsbacteria bacterium]|jgi:RNA polymerase sigma-70 factor (ECF subfamily)|nr:sigma-70 family RNA polymerase sigma factor [Candidatus Edwardsbacteria bacterium]
MTEQLQHAVERFQAGDRSAFNEIVRAHQREIYNLSYRITGNAEEAKDLTQDAFLRAFKALPGFRGDSSVRTWLYRIAINLGSDWRRKLFKAPLQLDEAADPPAPERDAGLALAVKRAVASLPFKQRTVFVMHHYQGFKHEEIARITKRSVGSVKANYFQASAKLRKQLQGYL